MTTLRDINCNEASDRAAFFVLGALDSREAAEVREHLATCSRAHEEFAEIGGVVPHLAELPDPLEPAPELRERILGTVEADVRARRREGDAAERLVASFGAQPRRVEIERPHETSAGVAVGPGLPVETEGRDTSAPGPEASAPPPDAVTVANAPVSPPEPAAELPPAAPMLEPRLDTAPPAHPIAPSVDTLAPPASAVSDGPLPLRRVPARAVPRRPSMGRWLLSAAAVIAIVALGGWSFLLQSQAAEERQRVQLLGEALMARNVPNAAVAVLSGTDATSDATGTAIMPPGRPGYLVVQGLPPAPAGKTYQAWYLSGSEARSAGVLKVGADGVAVMSGLDPGASVDAMAVTLENEGGVERSSQPPIVHGTIGHPEG